MTTRSGPAALAIIVAAALLGSACASGNPRARRDAAFKSLEATVVDREHENPGSRGASFAGNGNYYLVFEAREGEATVRYRFQVTMVQYNHYAEGSRVQIIVGDNQLRDIRPLR
ncbi:MAG: hypothetical protein LC796_02710 [Acidobacteria bacterium]|nr:hypothetical protein [Acidobacteriota bacterium]MCA1611010.1 hypothetical protein [Acidobacteriota bacterium]